MSIKALDKFTVKKLTTAQVITSNYSAVKELVENALDADANNIEVVLQEKGLTCIEVKDNGSGIAEVDVPFMGLQSYTSKLSDFKDLESIESYGFRGEALTALCRVSSVKVITRTNTDDAARCYTLDIDGNITKAEFSHRSIGTTVRAEFLFKNYPVRRQYISNPKQANQDVNNVEFLLKDFALCRPEVRFSFTVDNNNKFIKNSKDTYEESVREIFGANVISDCEFLKYNQDDVDIQLTVPKKDLNNLTSISRINYSHIFINTRPVIFKEMKDLLVEMLTQYFGSKISSRKRPLIILNIKMPYSRVDVNLKPNKTEVLLKNKAEVLEMLRKILIDYYNLQVVETREDENTSIMTESPAYFDSTINDSESDIEQTSNKRKKNINENRTPAIKRRKSKINEEVVEVDENQSDNVANNLPAGVDNNTQDDITSIESISQLPEVDLGEDFSSQDIKEIPVLNREEVNNIMGKMIENRIKSELQKESINTEAAGIQNLSTAEIIENAVKNIDERSNSAIAANTTLQNSNTANFSPKITQSQWSKGHCLNIKGGTNVEIGGPSSEVTDKTNKKISKIPLNSDSESVGFSKFCQITRERILQRNPNLNSVDLAIKISKEWKYLDSEERQYYRDLVRKDKNTSNSMDNSSLNSKTHTKQMISLRAREDNKCRLLKLLKNAKNTKKKEKQLSNETSNGNLKTIITWDIDMAKVRENCYLKTQNTRENNNNCVIGRLNNNIWLVNLNRQIWLLSADQLFDKLHLSESEKAADKNDANIIDTYLNRWIQEKDDMSLLHPIFSLK